VNIPRRNYVTLLTSAVSVFLCVNAAAQEGYYGVDHDKWHHGFYSNLKRNDGVWTPVPYDKINNVVAPDGGAHVCAPRQVGPNKGVLFCVILPTEG
jgi:hypothetical protein